MEQELLWAQFTRSHPRKQREKKEEVGAIFQASPGDLPQLGTTTHHLLKKCSKSEPVGGVSEPNRTDEAHPELCLGECFQSGLTGKEEGTLSVGGAISCVGEPDQTKKEEKARWAPTFPSLWLAGV